MASRADRPPVVVLCGGRGTRLHGEGPEVPKPLVEIGGVPIVEHVVRIYAEQGFDRFILATGFKAMDIEFWAAREAQWPAGVEVRCVHTGADTPTGGRLRALRDELGDRRFCVTYADGLADIDLAAEVEHHARRGATVTFAAVRPALPFGFAELDDRGWVSGFEEKPVARRWVNGGFFVMEPTALELMDPDSVLEREPLQELARTGGLLAYRHEGFWRCLDTAKDLAVLREAWDRGAPWLRASSASRR